MKKLFIISLLLLAFLFVSTSIAEFSINKNFSTKDIFGGNNEEENKEEDKQNQDVNDNNEVNGKEEGKEDIDPNANEEVKQEEPKKEEQPAVTLNEVEKEDADAFLKFAQEMAYKDSLNDGDDIEMLEKAYTSAYLFEKAGQKSSMHKIHYIIARIYIRYNAPQLAISHARKCVKSTDVKLDDVDMAYGFEILARAHAAAGDKEKAQKYIDFAKRASESIRNPEEKQKFEETFKAEPWFDLF